MATNIQPLLLETPKPKTLYVLLSLVAVIGPLAFITPSLVDTSSSLGAHICGQAHFCDKALDPASCLAMVSEITSGGTVQIEDDATLLQMLLKKSALHIRDTIEMANDTNRRINDPREETALADCLELLDLSNDYVADSIKALAHLTPHSHSDVHTWLSGVLTYQVTCLDGLNGSARPIMEPKLKDLIVRARASLAMIVALLPLKHDVLQPLYGNFPSWITNRDRKLLQTMPNMIKANVIVAKDGSGKYRTVNKAVTLAPNNSKSRYVIYVKKGIYKENVEIEKSKINLMLTGDGMYATIITGSRNKTDKTTTYQSATVGKLLNLFI